MIKPVHKSTVKAMIRKGKPFIGFIAPSNVNSFHIRGGWHLGMAVNFQSIEYMEETLNNFSYYNCNSELGQRVRFWIES